MTKANSILSVLSSSLPLPTKVNVIAPTTFIPRGLDKTAGDFHAIHHSLYVLVSFAWKADCIIFVCTRCHRALVFVGNMKSGMSALEQENTELGQEPHYGLYTEANGERELHTGHCVNPRAVTHSTTPLA